MKMDGTLTMSEEQILDIIDRLEPGEKVAFRCGNREKLLYSYQVTEIKGTTVYVRGPGDGKWRFEIATGSPMLQFVSPSRGVQTKGTLDALQRWKDVA